MIVRLSGVLATSFLLAQMALAVTEVGGQIAIDTTWSDPVYHVTESVLVSTGVTLTIQSGTVVKFDDRKGLSIHGTLLAQATPGNEIFFTDIRDDSVGGDSNGDGAATEPEPGWWTGIYIRNNADALLENIEVRYGGRYVQYIDEAAIHKSGAGMLSLRESAIRHSSRRALAFRDTTSNHIIEGNTIEQTVLTEAIFLRDNSGLINLADNRISNAHSYGIYALGANQLTISGNLIQNSGHSGMLLNGALISADVVANIIEGSAIHGIYVQDTTDAVELSFNTVLNTSQNGFYMVRSTSPALSNTVRGSGSQGMYVAGVESTPLLAGNQIYDNDIGILCAGSANPVIGGSQDQANDIHRNITAGVQNTTDTIIIDARYNWWGDATGPYHDTTNPGALGNSVSDWVDYGLYLDLPALDRVFGDRWDGSEDI